MLIAAQFPGETPEEDLREFHDALDDLVQAEQDGVLDVVLRRAAIDYFVARGQSVEEAEMIVAESIDVTVEQIRTVAFDLLMTVFEGIVQMNGGEILELKTNASVSLELPPLSELRFACLSFIEENVEIE